jgi:deazaflavin-dependent oxidoreductase (nitroreductase family)
MNPSAPPTIRSGAPPRAIRVPFHVRLFGPVLKALLVAGVPLGPNRLVTIRGRTSGLPRTAPIAIVKAGDRRWMWAPWGDVHWVRNLRAAGRATIAERGRIEEFTATELTQSERAAFFRDILRTYANGVPLGYWLVRIVDGVDLNRPDEIAADRRVFELHPLR